MKIISVIAQKGGTGKTTLALCLAVTAHHAKLNSLVIDLDPQGTAGNWSDRRQKISTAAGPFVIDAQPGRLPAALQKAREEGIDFVVIDTPARSEQSALAAAKAADLVLVPCRPQAYDLETIQNTRTVLSIAGNTPALAVLNAIPCRGDRHTQARRFLDTLEVPVCPHTIGSRSVFGDAGALGLTPQEYEPRGRAAEETRRLYTYISRILSNAHKQEKRHEQKVKTKSRRAG